MARKSVIWPCLVYAGFPSNISHIPCLNIFYFIGLDKRGIHIIFFFLHKNVCCGYSLEASRRGASNEYLGVIGWCEGVVYLSHWSVQLILAYSGQGLLSLW